MGSNFNVVLVILALLLSSQSYAVGEWRLDKKEDGIAVLSREFPGSKVREIKAVTRVNSSVDALVAVINDVPNSIRLSSVVTEASIVSRVNDWNYTVYNRMSMPWPVQDRDVLSCREFNRNNDTLVVTITDVACTGMPSKKNVIRMQRFRQQWQFSPLPEGEVEIELVAHSEPGGPIPSWMVNSMSTDVPYEMLGNLRVISKLEPYISVRYSPTNSTFSRE